MQYYVNKNAQENGDHEVHIRDCPHFPEEEHVIALGNFWTCRDAVHAASKHFTQVNGCYYCVGECNTG